MSVKDTKVVGVSPNVHFLITSLKHIGLRQKGKNQLQLKTFGDVLVFLFEHWLNSNPKENIRTLNRGVYFPVPGYPVDWDKPPIAGKKPDWISVNDFKFLEEEEVDEAPKIPMKLIIQPPAKPEPIGEVPKGELFDSDPMDEGDRIIPPDYPSDEEVLAQYNEGKLVKKRVSLREMR